MLFLERKLLQASSDAARLFNQSWRELLPAHAGRRPHWFVIFPGQLVLLKIESCDGRTDEPNLPLQVLGTKGLNRLSGKRQSCFFKEVINFLPSAGEYVVCVRTGGEDGNVRFH